VSHSFQTGLSTGIQRVVRETIKNLDSSEANYRLIWLPFGNKGTFQDVTDFYGIEHDFKNDMDGMGASFFLILRKKVQSVKFFTHIRRSKLLKRIHDKIYLCLLRRRGLRDYEPQAQDSILLIDVYWNDERILKELELISKSGVRVNLFVHDIFPIIYPEWFDKHSVRLFGDAFLKALEMSNSVTTSSDSNRKALEHFIQEVDSPLLEKYIRVVRLGTDHLYANQAGNPTQIRSGLVWISTIEPRKNITLLLDFLTSSNLDIQVTIIGRVGWKSDLDVWRLRKLKKLGKLRWLDHASDSEVIEELSTGLIGIVTSIDEGFGLPAYEFLRAGLKVIAPDIPVFREIEVDGIQFYEPNDLKSFSESLLKTIHDASDNPEIRPLPTWKNFVSQLTEITH
jgi:glycosyltransferase involved in cell wall biosynthesis